MYLGGRIRVSCRKLGAWIGCEDYATKQHSGYDAVRDLGTFLLIDYYSLRQGVDASTWY